MQVPVDLTDQQGDLSELRGCGSDGFAGTSSCTEVCALSIACLLLIIVSNIMVSRMKRCDTLF